MSRSVDVAHVLEWLRSGHLQSPQGFDPAAGGEEEFNRLALLFQSVFMGRDGEAVLEVLLDATLRRPAVDHRLGAADYLRFAQLREGQNSAMAIILTYLDRAEHLQRTNHASPGRSSGPGPAAGPAFPPSPFYAGLGSGEPEPSGPWYGREPPAFP